MIPSHRAPDHVSCLQLGSSDRALCEGSSMRLYTAHNCGSSCEKVTGSNVINVLKGGSGGLCPPGAKTVLLVTDNRRSRLDSPFCVITQHRKFEFGHHRQSKKISNAQQLSQTLKFQPAQLQITQKRSCPSTLLLFFNFYIT